MTLLRIVGLPGVAIFLTYMLPNAKSDEVLSPAAQRGFVILKTNCSRCHAIGKIGESPLKIAPPFRTLHERYPVEDLEKPLAEGNHHRPSNDARVPVRSGSGRGHHRLPEITRTLTTSQGRTRLSKGNFRTVGSKDGWMV